MNKLKVRFHNKLKSVNRAINRHKTYELTTIKELLVLSYFCKVEASNSTDALKGIDNVLTIQDFNTIIDHLVNIGLLHQINNRGKFKIFAPTTKGVNLYNTMIYT